MNNTTRMPTVTIIHTVADDLQFTLKLRYYTSNICILQSDNN